MLYRLRAAYVWLLLCFSCKYFYIWMDVNKWFSFLNVGLWSLNSVLCVVSGIYSVSMHSSKFWYTVWNVLCYCAQYTFLIYCLEILLFLCTVHISDIPSGMFSVSVHSTHILRTVHKVFSFCSQFTLLMPSNMIFP
jgi:hypothetical protein